MHSGRVGEIMAAAGYPPESVERTQRIMLKKDFKKDAEAQTVEDALCLVFLEKQFAEFRWARCVESLLFLHRVAISCPVPALLPFSWVKESEGKRGLHSQRSKRMMYVLT